MSEQLTQALELVLTFFALYGLIIYFFITAENNKYFQKQK